MRHSIALACIMLVVGCGDSESDGDAGAVDTGSVDGGDVAADSDAGADTAVDGSETDGSGETDTDCDGCSDDADVGEPVCPPTPGGEVSTWPLGEWTVALDTGNGAWSVTPDGAEAPVLSAPPTCGNEGSGSVRVALGSPRVVNEFGAFRITLEGSRVPLTWFDADGVPTPVEPGTEAVAFEYSFSGTERGANLIFTPTGDDLRVELAGAFDAGSFAWTLSDDESWFGLGSQVTGLDLRGRRYPLWTQEQGNSKPEDPLGFPLQNVPEAAYAPMGVWHTTAGWSAVVTHDAYTDIDLGKTDPHLVVLRSYAALPGFVMVSGDTPKERLTAVTEYTGRLPFEPAAWTFGPWNDSVGGSERLRQVATTLRDAEIPSSAIWSEDWIGVYDAPIGFMLSYAWAWDPVMYPTLVDDIAWLHDRGFAFLAYFNTFVPETTDMWQEGVDGGYLFQGADGSVRTMADPGFRTTGLVDLTNPDAVAWLRGYMDTAAATLGIDGWMADFTEWAPVDIVPDDGTDAWHLHNRYPLLWQQANSDALQAAHPDEGAEPTNNWTYFARSGWASVNGGSGGITPTMWGGDQNTNWDYDDGYPTVIPIATHLGLSGVPIFGSDVGGYNSLFGDATTKELFLRWSSMAAFHPLMRTHHGSTECGNWAFDRDDDTLAHYRRWATVHALLYPLFRSLTGEAQTSGWPVTRHPWLVEPGAPALWSGDDFLFFVGDDLLVAPVLEEGAEERRVELPSAGWWPLFGAAPVAATGDPIAGWTSTVAATAVEIPVFVRPGTILPLLADAPESFYGPTTDLVSSLDSVTGFRLALYPDADGGLRPVTYESMSVSGSGWSAPVFEGATWDDEPLPDCDGSDPGESCVDTTFGTAFLAGSGTLRAGSAELVISTEDGATALVGIGSGAWAPWDDPTDLGDLHPDIPPPCDSVD